MAQHVLLIQVDQMHAGALSVMRSANVRTSRLDGLAGQGVLFRHAVCNNPICMPSRVSMLSGTYPSTNRQFGFSGLCDARMSWLPRVFRDAGYRTGAFGKFHTLCVGQRQWGFDVAAPTAGEDEDLARPTGNHYRAYCQSHGVPWPTDQIHCHNPHGGPNPVPPTATDTMHWARQRSCQSTVPVEHSLETYTTNRCIDFLRDTATAGKASFTWLTYDRPHSPTTLPKPWFDMIDPDAIELPPMPGAQQMEKLPPSYFKALLEYAGIGAMGEADFRFVLATYFKLIEFIDSEIGRVLDTLIELGMDDDTTIVFTADHGDEAGTAGLYDKSRTVGSDAITRVPLIIRPAARLACSMRGIERAEPVELVDIAPTLCALAGVEAPTAFEGRDLSDAILAGSELDASRAVVCEDYWRRMITHDGWMLIFDTASDAEQQLYDLTTDNQCHDNRYDDTGCVERRLDLKRQLLAFLVQRLHGPFDQADVERVERGLDRDDPTLAPLLCAAPPGMQCYRAACAVSDEQHLLWVPFYDAPMLLFPGARQYYRSKADAITFDNAAADRLLDAGLHECYAAVHPISLWITRRVHDWMCPPNRPDAVTVRQSLQSAAVVSGSNK